MSTSDPQTINRYAYVTNDPINSVDPNGLYEGCVHKGMTTFLAKLSGKFSGQQANDLGRFASDEPGRADSGKYSATSPKNVIKGFFGRGPSARIHFASEERLKSEIQSFPGYIALGDFQSAGFVLHSIEDVHGAHQGYHLPFGHLIQSIFGHSPDAVIGDIGDAKFLKAANHVFKVLSGDKNATLTAQQVNDLIDAIVAACGKKAKNLRITRPVVPHGGGGGGGYIEFYPSWRYDM